MTYSIKNKKEGIMQTIPIRKANDFEITICLM